MKIGIIGLGVVGNAIKNGFERLNHKVLCHDLKLKSTIDTVKAVSYTHLRAHETV